MQSPWYLKTTKFGMGWSPPVLRVIIGRCISYLSSKNLRAYQNLSSITARIQSLPALLERNCAYYSENFGVEDTGFFLFFIFFWELLSFTHCVQYFP